MENNWFKMDLDLAMTYWDELDSLLDDRSFCNLKEIRLLFESFITKELLAEYQSNLRRKYRHEVPEPWSGFLSEDAVSLFKSYALKSSAKGIRITSGLTDIFLPSNH